jgi:hypothetical protein
MINFNRFKCFADLYAAETCYRYHSRIVNIFGVCKYCFELGAKLSTAIASSVGAAQLILVSSR